MRLVVAMHPVGAIRVVVATTEGAGGLVHRATQSYPAVAREHGRSSGEPCGRGRHKGSVETTGRTDIRAGAKARLGKGSVARHAWNHPRPG